MLGSLWVELIFLLWPVPHVYFHMLNVPKSPVITRLDVNMKVFPQLSLGCLNSEYSENS